MNKMCPHKSVPVIKEVNGNKKKEIHKINRTIAH